MKNEFDYLAARRVLEKTGISQAWIAKQLGLTVQTVNHYFTGKQVPSRAVVIALAKILRVDECELMAS